MIKDKRGLSARAIAGIVLIAIVASVVYVYAT
jgi:hypothetical protein